MPTPGATSSGFWSGGQRPLRPMGSGRGVLRQGWPASSPRLEKAATRPCSSTAPTAMTSGMLPADSTSFVWFCGAAPGPPLPAEEMTTVPEATARDTEDSMLRSVTASRSPNWPPRLRLTTSAPCATAQSMAAGITEASQVFWLHTRATTRSTSGAPPSRSMPPSLSRPEPPRAARMPATWVPCPSSSNACATVLALPRKSRKATSSPLSRLPATRCFMLGWCALMPVSRNATVTPRPVRPSCASASSCVTSYAHSVRPPPPPRQPARLGRRGRTTARRATRRCIGAHDDGGLAISLAELVVQAWPRRRLEAQQEGDVGDDGHAVALAQDDLEEADDDHHEVGDREDEEDLDEDAREEAGAREKGANEDDEREQEPQAEEDAALAGVELRSEEHTSELQS